MVDVSVNAMTPESADRIGSIRAAMAALEPKLLEIEDESDLHRGHAGAKGGGGHFRMHIVSARFTGMSKIARHRLVYALLANRMHHDIHAVSLTLLAPDER